MYIVLPIVISACCRFNLHISFFPFFNNTYFCFSFGYFFFLFFFLFFLSFFLPFFFFFPHCRCCRPHGGSSEATKSPLSSHSSAPELLLLSLSLVRRGFSHTHTHAAELLLPTRCSSLPLIAPPRCSCLLLVAPLEYWDSAWWIMREEQGANGRMGP